MEFTSSDLDELGIKSERNDKGKDVSMDIDDDGSSKYKSKNLHAERRRRQKISDRLLELRSLVPIITNMKKATIVCDAIDYITELQGRVRELSEELLEMDTVNSEEEIQSRGDEKNEGENMKKCGIETEVKLIQIDYNKLWVKLVYNKKRGALTKLIEAMIGLGYEFTDTSLITSRGAVIVTSCLEGIYGVSFSVEETKELLLDIINTM